MSMQQPVLHRLGRGTKYKMTLIKVLIYQLPCCCCCNSFSLDLVYVFNRQQADSWSNETSKICSFLSQAVMITRSIQPLLPFPLISDFGSVQLLVEWACRKYWAVRRQGGVEAVFVLSNVPPLPTRTTLYSSTFPAKYWNHIQNSGVKIVVVLIFSLALKRQTTEFDKCDNKFCIPGLPVHQLSFTNLVFICENSFSCPMT